MTAKRYRQARWSQSVPNDWLKHIDARCKEMGITRAHYVRMLLRADMPREVWWGLSVPQTLTRRAEMPPEQTKTN